MTVPPALQGKKLSYDAKQIAAIRLAKNLLRSGMAGSFHEAIRTASLRFGLDPATFTSKCSSKKAIGRMRPIMKKNVLEARDIARSICKRTSKGLQF
jgi:hypothetical protein